MCRKVKLIFEHHYWNKVIMIYLLLIIFSTICDTKTDVNPGEAPYVVSIWNQGNFKCGGIILNAFRIFTTGHCVRNTPLTELLVIAGHNQVLKKSRQIQWLSVDYIDIHSDYEEILHADRPTYMKIKNNYAVLTLTEPLVWGPTISRAPLPNENFNPTGQICKSFRWHNAYTVDDEVLLQLVGSQEFILNAQDCHGAGVAFEADESCMRSLYAERPGNVDSSGNPVVCEGFVIGIIGPNFLRNPQLSNFKSVLDISPFRYLLNDVCSRD